MMCGARAGGVLRALLLACSGRQRPPPARSTPHAARRRRNLFPGSTIFRRSFQSTLETCSNAFPSGFPRVERYSNCLYIVLNNPIKDSYLNIHIEHIAHLHVAHKSGTTCAVETQN